VGDFNVRSPLNERLPPRCCMDKSRTEPLESFLVARKIFVHNPYDVKIFSNYNGSSVIDLVISSINLAGWIRNVKIERNTLFPHNSVLFIINKCVENTGKATNTKVDYDLYVKKFDVSSLNKWISKFRECTESCQSEKFMFGGAY